MSDDLIKRSDAIDAIHSYWKSELSKMPTTDSEYGEVIDGDCDTLLKHNKELSTRIKDIPSADRLQGEWIDNGWHGDWQFETDDRGNCWKEFECSNCNCRAKYITPFCPQCGAKMKGVDDETAMS